MKKSLASLATIYACWIALFLLAKIIFMTCYPSMYLDDGLTGYLTVLWHGLRMDCATAAYLTAPCLLIMLVTTGIGRNGNNIALKIYLAVAVLLVTVILIADTALYGYWDFKLDVTPLFFLTTNPQAAAASAPVWMITGGVILIGLLCWGITKLFYIALKKTAPDNITGRERWVTLPVLVVAGGILFLAMRGGVGVATINMSSAFFSNNMRLNHAAVNPAFSLLYSATHQQSFDKMFRLMSDDEAAAMMANELSTAPYLESGLLNDSRPDVFLVILESFSNHLMPSLGGDSVAVKLDSIAGSGLSFTNCYASSFRTDRGLVCILDGFPGAPTTSLAKMPEKTRLIPSLARSLGAHGYTSRYFYGGDATFANKLTHLLNTGFDNVTQESDFDPQYRTGKWGVPDHLVVKHAIDELQLRTEHGDTAAPVYWVVQTLSSHEPFEVPYTSRRWKDDERANAFAYTDSCTATLVNALQRIDTGRPKLIVITADHWGCWPQGLDATDAEGRHRIPLVLTGDALALTGEVTATTSQTDIIAMLLDGMGIDRSGFTFSRNPLDPTGPHNAFMSTPNYVALADSTGHVRSTYILDSGQFTPESTDSTANRLTQAYLQTIYDSMAALK